MRRMFHIVAITSLMLVALSLPGFAANVTFQVNMSVQDGENHFDPAVDQVVVRGGFNGWGGNANTLAAQGEGLYSGTWDLAAGGIEYKFVILPNGGSDVWEGVDNRTATVGTDPLVIPVVWFNNDSVINALTDVEVLFRVDMRVQQLNGNFDPNTDWVVVRGNHPNIGNWGGATRLDLEAGNPGVYSQRIQFAGLPIGAAMEYKFVILDNGDPNAANWESSANRSFTPSGNEPDNLPPPNGNDFGEINPDLVFFSDVDFNDILSHDVNVIFQVEVTPLIGRLALGCVRDVQSGDSVCTIEEINCAGFFNNWPWGNFSDAHTANDNGQDGDQTAGDHVWSKRILFAAGQPRLLVYKYGANDLDVEAGFARNHERTIDDSGDEFRMDVDCWGSPDTLYDDWDCVISAADDGRHAPPAIFTLEQNYPNPFNPSTAISFTLTRNEFATLSVFDVTGREVSTVNLGYLQSGRHTVGIDGTNWSTGVYFYTLKTPQHSETRKMLLLK